ncbi:hypothetical protein JCM8097_007846 [Rhodosporidiobolus ruineniae]
MPFRMPPPAQHPSTLTPSTSAPSLTGTLRLPAPPPPPKPLHLTMSVRGRAAAFERGTITPVEADEAMGAVGSGESRRSGRRGALPRWSVAEGECDDGQHCGGEDDEQKEADEARRMVDSLLPPSSSAHTARQAMTSPSRRDPSGDSNTTATTSSGGGSEFRTPVGTLRTPHSYAAGSSSRRASTYTVTGRDGRRSIYFDATRENPFVPPSPPALLAEGAGGEGEEAEEEKTTGSTFTLHGKTSSSSLLASDPPPPPTPTPGPLNDPHFLALPLHASPAITLHAFEGEPQFGELSFGQGVWMRVEIEEMGEGWSLGYVDADGEEGRGLIPRGYYAYVDPPPEEQQAPASPPPLPSPARSVSPSTPTLPSLPHEGTPSSTRTAQPVTPPGAAAVPLPPSAPATPAAAHPAAPPSTPPSRVRPSPLSVSTTSATNLGLGAIPRDSPYATRSIGRHVVVSGTEFEPIPSPVSGGDSGRGTTLSAEAELEAAGELSVEELLAQQEEDGQGARMARRASEVSGGESEAELAAIEDEVWRVHEEEMRAKEVYVVEKEEEEEEEEGDLPKSASAVDERLAPVEPSTPLSAEPAPPFTPSRTTAPPALPSSTFLNLLGLSSPSSGGGLTFRLPVPLPGRSTIPGASVLAATSAPASPAKKRRLPRLEDKATGGGGGAAAAYDGREVLMRWVREGDEADEAVLREVEADGEVQVWDVETGPAWRPLAEPFTVQLHSPVKHTPMAGAAYTTYSLTSTFWSSPASDEADESTTSTIVSRRYSHFVALHALLSARFLAPLVVVPALPSKAFGAARFADGFVETRRRELERWVERVGRHPVLGGSEELRRFLEIEDEKELHRHLLLSHPSSLSPASALSSTSKAPDALFPARVFHPEFNLDQSEAEELVERFEAHCRAVELGGGWRDVEREVGKGREGERAGATDLLALSHSLIRLSAGLALPPTSYDKPSEVDERETELERQQRRAREWGLQDGRGGMGWKEEDDDALCLAKAIQGTAEALANVADVKDDAARTSLLRVHEVLHEHAQPYSQYLPLIDLHRTLLSEYRRLSRLSSSSSAGQEALNRCETALNITCAEIERVRVETNEDLREAVEGWLDAMISVQEQSLAHLHQARALFSPEAYPSLALTGPRLRSPLEARLSPSSSTSPSGAPYPPLPQPSTAGAAGALKTAGAAVGSVLLPVAGGGTGGLKRAQTVTGALSTSARGRREYELDEPDEEEAEDEEEAGGATREKKLGEGVMTSWRDSIWGGTMSLFR